MAVKDFRGLDKNVNAARVQAIMADLAAGFTFAQLAKEAAANSPKRQRNRNNARKAYESVTKFSKKTTLTPAEEKALNDGLTRLKSVLEQLGDTSSAPPNMSSKDIELSPRPRVA